MAYEVGIAGQLSVWESEPSEVKNALVVDTDKLLPSCPWAVAHRPSQTIPHKVPPQTGPYEPTPVQRAVVQLWLNPVITSAAGIR